MAEEIARRFMVSGRVQGVGYRNFVEHEAGKLQLHGYVRNLRDGRVEVFAMGTEEHLKKLLAALKKGPMMAQVSEVREEPDTHQRKYIGHFTIEVTE
jgi:acylphosphatase